MGKVSIKSEELVLVEGLRSGDPAALRSVYKAYFLPLKAYLLKNGADAEEAKDIFQETVMVVYRLVQKEEFELRSSFLSLLIGIGRNIWRKSLRKRMPYTEISDPEVSDRLLDPGEDVVEAIRSRQVDALFREKLLSLGEQCQRILNLFFDGKKMTEIVAEVGLSSVSFAKKKKFQCKERLVELVRKDPLFTELKAS